MIIDATKLSEVLNGEWIVPPPSGWKFETVTMSKQQSKLEKGKAILFIAIDEETWYEGASDQGFYSGWTDTHEIVHEIAEDLSGIIVQRHLKDIDENIPQLLVDNTYETIKDLAVFIREIFTGNVVSITGTVGKSSTKNMLNHVLSDAGSVVATREGDNTITGVPLTISSGVTKPDYLILETAISALWMNSGGISKVAKPHISIITSIGGREKRNPIETARLKAKICEGIVPGGFALLNKEMIHFEEVKNKVEKLGATVITYGLTRDTDIYLMESTSSQGSTFIKINIWEDEIEYDVPLIEEGMVLNTLAVLGAVWLLELNVEEASKQLKEYQASGSVFFREIEHYKDNYIQ